MKKFLAIAVSLCCFLCFGSACSGTPTADFPFITEDDESNYNKELFFQNDLETLGADPSVIYIDDEQSSEYGWYYMYCTTDALLDTRGFGCWKSKDLQSWQFVSVAFYPESDSWSRYNLWAPEVIYDESDGKYYMFYNATDNYNVEGRADGTEYLDFEQHGSTKKCIGVAVSDTPYGPFEQGGSDRTKPLIQHSDLTDTLLETGDENLSELISLIDASPFIDPKTGEKYLYFVRSHVERGTDSVICGMKMKSWLEPDFSTTVQLTSCEKRTVDNGNSSVERTDWSESGVNEGPFMFYDNGVYYLTLSINGYTNKLYSVIQATGDSPLGTFEKLAQEDGAYVLQAETSWGFASGTGHHSFVRAHDELWIVYHAHTDRNLGSSQRGMAADRVFITKNLSGESILYCNGPTYSLQPLPESVSGYRNITSEAEITAKKLESDSSLSYLTDKLYKVHTYYDFVKDTELKANGKIELEFEDYRKIRAIMIVNTIEDEKYFEYVENISLSFEKFSASENETVRGTVNTGRVDFNKERYFNINQTVQPGSSLVVEFEELSVKKISITFPNYSCAVSEIIVLGV